MPQPGSNRANIRVRGLTLADIPLADSVRSLAGWNQTPADWERFLAAEPSGCFLAEWEGEPAGTATTTVYDEHLAWIGMVLVHPRFRRRGIGTALLQHCIAYLQQQRGVRCLKLDATPEGKPVYERLGFQTEWGLKRYEGRPRLLVKRKPLATIRSWCEADLQNVVALDAHAFGVSRQRLLMSLAKASLYSVVFEESPGKVAGYGFARAGVRATYLGPVAAVASSPEAGVAVAEALLERLAGHSVFWDIPDANEPAIELAKTCGLTVQRPLIRMFFGANDHAGDPRAQIALAGPEVG